MERKQPILYINKGNIFFPTDIKIITIYNHLQQKKNCLLQLLSLSLQL